MAAGARGRGAELGLISASILCLGDHDIRSENAKREIGISTASLARATAQLCLELYSEIYTKRDFAMGRVLSRVVARRGQ